MATGPGDTHHIRERPLLLCLVPARNAEADLPGFLESAARCCDAILALDDGSTDATYDILAASPLVARVLRNPRREDYREWDDAENRNRLLEAAAEFNPEWIISLDADERLDATDAADLRSFLETDALPGFAYGFRHVPMRNDLEHFWPKYQWIYRLFSYEPGLRFPNQKLHFIPIPTAIPRNRWLKTTLRVQHLGGMTAERRLARYNKYLEADPDRTYQASYGHLLRPPAEEDVRRWQPRPASIPVLLADHQRELTATDETGTAGPAISAIIIAQNDEATIARSVASVVNQECPESFEVIVVTSGSDRTAEIVSQHFPTVTHIALEKPALPGEARNAGLKVARGTFVSFPGSHVELLPGSLAARLRAHRRGYAMVTGVTENGNTTPAGWASYFLDHHEGLPGHPRAELNGPPAHCSYARLPLLEVGGFPEGVRTAEDTAVNRALVRRGYVALRDPDIHFVHRSPCTTLRGLARHHFKRGRGWGRLLVADYRECGGLLNPDVLKSRLLRHVPRRLGRIDQNVAAAREDLDQRYRDVLPLVICGAVATWAGLWCEVLRPAPGKWEILAAKPVLNVLVGTTDETPVAALAQVDHVAGKVTFRRIPSDLPVQMGSGQAVPLATALTGTRADGGQTAALQAAAGRTLDIDRLDCLVGPAFLMRRLLPASMAPEAQHPESGHGPRLGTRLLALRALATGKVSTTLGPLQLLRFLDAMRKGHPLRQQ